MGLTENDIKRINELSHKSKAEGLTDEEKAEQKKLREEYEIAKARNDIRLHYPKVLEEASILEQKVKEGKESVDRYIVERERESLIEIGLERLLKKK